MPFLKNIQLQKEACGYVKRKVLEKMDKCSRYLKQWVLRCLPWKRRRKKWKKDSPCSLAKVFFKFQTREIWFKEHSRIRIATIHIFHTHAHLDLRVWHFSPWILVLTLQYMQCEYVFKSRKKKARSCMPWWGSKNTTYISDLRVLQKEKVSYVFFSKS
jgi:hypothetical protein